VNDRPIKGIEDDCCVTNEAARASPTACKNADRILSSELGNPSLCILAWGEACTTYRRGQYGSGTTFIVVYTKIPHTSDCIENHAINSESPISHHFLSQLSTYHASGPLVKMSLRTVSEEIQLVVESTPLFPALSPLLQAMPPVSISDLRLVATICCTVDNVDYCGTQYAFKHHDCTPRWPNTAAWGSRRH
jgi:hypothetical protein